jgi:unsaturated rhamnogalacturonyl hydrolase
MKTRLLTCALSVCLSTAQSQTAADTWSVKFSDAIIARYQPTINTMTSKGWEYSNSIVLCGMEKVYAHTSDADYLNYIKAYVDAYVDGSGNITGMAQNLDKIHPGLLCLFLYEKTGLAKYQTAATYIRNYLMGPSSTYPKTAEGGYYHKNTAAYTNVMMVDGIYMAHPFLAKYGKMFNDNACFDTATSQALLLASHVHDNAAHLVKHAFDYAKTNTWASPTTGVSFEVWSRGMGWYVMALVDILKYLPPTHADYNNIKNLMADLAIGIQNTQDPATGLWYQVVDKGGSAGNYLEMSGSAMFVYAIKTAVDSGWINASFLPVAQNGWTGLQTKISTYTDTRPAINDFAPAMGVQNNYAAYVAITSVDAPTASGTQHPHGYAALLMAASVMEFPLSTLPARFTDFTANVNKSGIELSWKNADDTQVDHYIIQRSNNGTGFSTIEKIMSNGLGIYNLADHHAAGNVLYYRIQAIAANGSVYNSRVLSVKLKTTGPNLLVAPNPIKGGLVNMSLNNIRTGKYQLKIINSSGKLIKLTAIQITEEKTVQTIQLPLYAGKGLYYVLFEGPEIFINKSIVIE